MTIEVFLLFLAMLLFGGFSLYTNIKAGSTFIKFTTFAALYAAIAGCVYVLVTSLSKI